MVHFRIKKFAKIALIGIYFRLSGNFEELIVRIEINSAFSCYRYFREEPFSVISVDMRNHSNLLDSLEQYVKGELLEGVDAYHCDKCDKKVTI